MPLRDAWYWSKVVLLNNLLHGSPELPYYEPRAMSAGFLPLVATSAALAAVAIALGGGALFSTTALGPLGATGIALAALLIGVAVGVFATVRGMRLGPEARGKPSSHRRLAEAVATTDRARRQALAQEASALDPDDVGSRLLLADALELELGECAPARVQLIEAIEAIDRAGDQARDTATRPPRDTLARRSRRARREASVDTRVASRGQPRHRTLDDVG
ncbi:MAG: hypothetical protein K1X94_28485 [Sandaracinaceae bacterium]|nr:hypothetical protein [Sandaracinaceae bacterium]